MADDFTTWCPTVPLDIENEWRMNVAQYGDGYQMRALDGINALNQTFSVTYEKRPQRMLDQMNLYLYNKKADLFPFKLPSSGIIINVFCNSWDISWDMVQWDAQGIRTVYGTLSADFIRAYGAGYG